MHAFDRRTDRIVIARPRLHSMQCGNKTNKAVRYGNIFSEHVHVHYMSPPVRLSSVCRLSVTFMHFTQAIEIFGYVLRHLVRWPSPNIQVKYLGNGAR